MASRGVSEAFHIIVKIGGLVDGLRGLACVRVVLGDLARHNIVNVLEHEREFRPQTGRAAKSKAGGAILLFHMADEVFNFSLHLVPVRMSCPQCNNMFAAPGLEHFVFDELGSVVAPDDRRQATPEGRNLFQMFPHAVARGRGFL